MLAFTSSSRSPSWVPYHTVLVPTIVVDTQIKMALSLQMAHTIMLLECKNRCTTAPWSRTPPTFWCLFYACRCCAHRRKISDSRIVDFVASDQGQYNTFPDISGDPSHAYCYCYLVHRKKYASMSWTLAGRVQSDWSILNDNWRNAPSKPTHTHPL